VQNEYSMEPTKHALTHNTLILELTRVIKKQRRFINTGALDYRLQ